MKQEGVPAEHVLPTVGGEDEQELTLPSQAPKGSREIVTFHFRVGGGGGGLGVISSPYCLPKPKVSPTARHLPQSER